MTDWTRMYDARGDTDQVPRLLDRVARQDDTGTWAELGFRLVLECDLVFPASFAALPHLVRLAEKSVRALGLAGEIVGRAAGHHGCDDLLRSCDGTVIALGDLLDRHLRTRPAPYLPAFRALLAVREQYHWASVLEDFSDDFYRVSCPACHVEVTLAIGDYGRYSAVRDWHAGDVDRRALRPASAEQLSGAGRWMYDTVVRDGRRKLAEGIAHLFGKAVCPCCASVFGVAEEYAAAYLPVMG
ncbi:hypothetical protein OG786_14895 [Streptomyces sp. NBC_00101]|uniref:hypothetical protein n=1 Tax=Streptomyces sp. NBC_00101 TaxID=2975651 RepID=UPI003248EB13